MFRAREHRLERGRSRDDGQPLTAVETRRPGARGRSRRPAPALFFTEIRVAVGSYAECRAAAGVLRGASSAENRLVERYPRPFGLGPLYLRRVRHGCGNVMPSRRGVLATAELAGLWHVPSADLKIVRLERSAVPRAVAPAEITRAPEHALARGERGPVGIVRGSAGLGLVGGQGTGKTSVVCRTIAADVVTNDCAVIVRDPKSDLARKALSTIPGERTVHYLDFGAPEVGFNPLLAPGDAAMVADKLVKAFKDIPRPVTSGRARTAICAGRRAPRSARAVAEPRTGRRRYGTCTGCCCRARTSSVTASCGRSSRTPRSRRPRRSSPVTCRTTSSAPTLTTGKLDALRNKLLRLLFERLTRSCATRASCRSTSSSAAARCSSSTAEWGPSARTTAA